MIELYEKILGRRLQDLEGREKNIRQIFFREVLKKIDPREAIVLVLRYDQRLTYNQIGETIGTTGSRAKQLCVKGTGKLRHPVRRLKLEKIIPVN